MQFNVGDRVRITDKWFFEDDQGRLGIVKTADVNVRGEEWYAVTLDNGTYIITTSESIVLELRLPQWKREVR